MDFTTNSRNFDMTNAELLAKIKAEIENALHILGPGYNEMEMGQISAYGHILSFLSTLESEKPMTLEEEINLWISENENIHHGDKLMVWLLKEVARHFAQWGYLRAAEKYDEIEYNRQRAEESVPNDLEEAAKKYATEWHKNPDGSAWKPYFEVSAIKAFIAGAKWQKEQYHFFNKAWAENMQAELDRNYENGKQAMKEQMMKGAVEGTVDFEYFGYKVICSDLKQLDTLLESMSHGDKVRIIIVKEGEK